MYEGYLPYLTCQGSLLSLRMLGTCQEDGADKIFRPVFLSLSLSSQASWILDSLLTRCSPKNREWLLRVANVEIWALVRQSETMLQHDSLSRRLLNLYGRSGHQDECHLQSRPASVAGCALSKHFWETEALQRRRLGRSLAAEAAQQELPRNGLANTLPWLRKPNGPRYRRNSIYPLGWALCIRLRAGFILTFLARS